MTDLAEPSLSEIARQVSDFRNEFRAAVGQLVRADVYNAQREGMMRDMESMRDAMDRRIAALERGDRTRDEREVAQRRMMQGAGIAAIVSAVVTVVQMFGN